MKRRKYTHTPPLRRKFVNEVGPNSRLSATHPISRILLAAGIEVDVDKHKDGPTGLVKLAFQKEFFRFEDLANE